MAQIKTGLNKGNVILYEGKVFVCEMVNESRARIWSGSTAYNVSPNSTVILLESEDEAAVIKEEEKKSRKVLPAKEKPPKRVSIVIFVRILESGVPEFDEQWEGRVGFTHAIPDDEYKRALVWFDEEKTESELFFPDELERLQEERL